MNVELFQAFIDVYRHQSFAEVAKRKNMAPSSITRMIAQLEEELGFRLFQRTTRKVSPTEKGEEFYRRILPIHEELGQLKEQLADQSAKATLRVTANVSFSHTFLNKILIKFKKKYPHIDLEIVITDDYVDLVKEKIDVAIRFGKLADSSFVGAKLFDLDYVLVASPSYMKGKKITKPSDIKKYDCIGLLISRYNLIWKFRRRDMVDEIPVQPHIKAHGAIPLIEYAKAGLGVTMVARKMVEQDLKARKLVQLLDKYEMSPTDLGAAAWVLYPSKDFVPSKVKLFVDFLRNEIRS